MLYSQLYRSILRACRDFSRHPHTKTTLAISLPLLISVPSAYGAIISPQTDNHSSVESATPANLGDIVTLKDSSTQSVRSLSSQQPSATQIAKQTTVQVNTPSTVSEEPLVLTKSSDNKTTNSESVSDTQVKLNKPNVTGHVSGDTDQQSPLTSDANNNSATTVQQVTKRVSQKEASHIADSKNTGIVKSKAKKSKQATQKASVKSVANHYKTNSHKLETQVKRTSKTSVDNSDSDEQGAAQKLRNIDNLPLTAQSNLAPQSDNDSISDSTSSLVSTAPPPISNEDGYIGMTESNASAADIAEQAQKNTANAASNTKAPETTANNNQASGLKKRASDSKTLSESFEEDSVQKSLERLAEFYQIQASDLRDRLSNSDTASTESNVIDANASAPVAGPNIFKRQSAFDNVPRCEGIWVTPSNLGADEAYQQAIQRAQREDGLSTVNGLPLHAQADYAYYDNTTYVELAGNVEVMQNGQLVTADQVSLDLNTGIAGAKGRVLLADSGPTNPDSSVTNLEQLVTNQRTHNQNGLIAVADELAYNTTSSQATAYDVAFASVPMQAHGYAQKLNKPDETHYQLDKVMFSTCPPANRKWQIEAQQIDIDTESGRGEAYDATFRLGKVPVFYLPYFNFPIDDRRSTGLLTPSARIDSDNGLKLSVPYYLNLAPNYDATITTDVYTNRNPMLTGEFRYLTDNFGDGKLTAAFMPNDKEYDNEDRRGIFFEHGWVSKEIPRLSADAVFSYVSDPDYVSDFDDYGLVENRLNLPRRAQVNYYNDYVDAQFKVETFQSLDAVDVDGNEIQDKDKPYSRLPQLSVDYRLPQFSGTFNNLQITGTHDTAYFKKSIHDDSESEKSGVRLFNELSASYPLENTWGYVTPKVSLQHLYAAYDEESRIDNNVSRSDNDKTAFVPKFSVDSGVNLYQSGSPFGWFDNSLGGYQLLTPRLKYTYAAYDKQEDIPNFDTRVASFDYDQLFADSWFLGHDRLADSNNVSVGVNYRYIDAMGVTRFDGSIGDQFFLDKPKVTLGPDDETFDASSTGVAWRSSVQPYRNIWFDFNGALNSDNDLNYISSQIRYRPTPSSLINFGVVERKEDPITNQSRLSALTASTIIPISNNWRFMGQGQYDSRNNKFIDATLGVDYEDCCYGFSIYGRSYYNDLNLDKDPNHAVMAEFRIKGIGNRSSRLSRHLDDKVLGFEPVDSLWRSR